MAKINNQNNNELMIRPNFLKQGDTIGIAATARKISSIELKPAIDKLSEWGLKVVFADNIDKADNQFAGNDELRAKSFQSLLDDDNISAIICGRGGYGTVRIIEKLDFTKFSKKPKWIIGYSDVTVLHTYIHQKLGIETMHATMPINFSYNGKDTISTDSLKSALFGKAPQYNDIEGNERNIIGNTDGILVGGNLSVLYSVRGTSFDLDTDGKILFIEDLDEYLYHIDRMIWNLKVSGKLSKLKGLIVGGMTNMSDNLVPFGKDACEIISEAVSEYNYPVCFEFPVGHKEPNIALIMGRKIDLIVEKEKVQLKFSDRSS
ncbi:MAG: LD-carboxypeptidase [Bacteroidales bacterium]|nr:LD-carboxypeptidase [Bacteroidales bacterium]